jgi:hypothetical protein
VSDLQVRIGAVKPDIFISTTKGTYMIDVSVTHPSPPSALRAECRNWGANARLRERQKHKKYDHLCKSNGRKLIPFVMESYGAIGSEAKNLISEIAEEADTLGVEAKASFRRWAINVVAVALQVGNARTHMNGASRVRNWDSQSSAAIQSTTNARRFLQHTRRELNPGFLAPEQSREDRLPDDASFSNQCGNHILNA